MFFIKWEEYEKLTMQVKVLIGVLLILAGVGTAYYVRTHMGEKETLRSLQTAEAFVRAFFRGEDIREAYDMVSDAYQAVQSEEMTLKIRKATVRIVGPYQSYGKPANVTKLIDPRAPGHFRIFKFPLNFENDQGTLLLSMIQQKGKWRVQGFNINSPLITERQLDRNFT
ncbi:MAG: hypothetical protein JW893_08015 [Candidatus Omnitrophica bacterium]|nr:hypothetical protein [Candidatus Omnitrophota bacterium]